MKITQAGFGTPTGRSRKADKAGAADTGKAFRAHMDGDAAPEATATTAATPLAALTSLLTVQEAPDPADPRKHAIKHGDTLLDELRELQIGLTQGWVAEDTLRGLARMLDRPRPAIDDPELNRVLDDIELRAAVELAKLEKSSP